MTPRDNLLGLYRREGFGSVPAGFILCDSLELEFGKRYPEAESYQDHFNFPYRIIVDPGFSWNFDNLDMIVEQTKVDWHKFYPEGFVYDVKFDGWGIAHEDNPNSMHMTQMHHPMKNFTTLDEMKAYPALVPEKQSVSVKLFENKSMHQFGLLFGFVYWVECRRHCDLTIAGT